MSDRRKKSSGFKDHHTSSTVLDCQYDAVFILPEITRRTSSKRFCWSFKYLLKDLRESSGCFFFLFAKIKDMPLYFFSAVVLVLIDANFAQYLVDEY